MRNNKQYFSFKFNINNIIIDNLVAYLFSNILG